MSTALLVFVLTSPSWSGFDATHAGWACLVLTADEKKKDDEKSSGTTSELNPKRLKISGLLPNPSGKDEGNEQVELTNLGKTTLDLDKWALRDKAKKTAVLTGKIAAGASLKITLKEDSIVLNNSNEVIELLDPDGKVEHRVKYERSYDGKWLKFD